MVGEMRDLDTITTAITAAETGHLVFSTLHTNSASQTIDRIIDMYPADQQEQVRGQLALVLRSIVSMRLAQKRDGSGRIAAMEVLVNSPKISKHIEHNEIKELHDEIENSVAYYHMQSMNQSLIALLANDVIDYDTALQTSSDPEDLSLKLRKMFPSIEEKFREGIMAPSAADFSQITELLEIKRLYEELEERHKVKLQEKDEQIHDIEAEVSELRTALSSSGGEAEELRRQLEQTRAEVKRVKDESNQKINQLNERIRDLNQRLQGDTSKPASGFFKR
jgi:twitching motility protein PilT